MKKLGSNLVSALFAMRLYKRESPFHAKRILVGPLRFGDAVGQQRQNFARLQNERLAAAEFVARQKTQRNIDTVQGPFDSTIRIEDKAWSMPGACILNCSSTRLQAAKYQCCIA